MKSFLTMLVFLTRIPVRINSPIEERDIIKGIWFIPLIGLIIGGIMYAVYILLVNHISSWILAVILLLVYICVSGGLHLDGLADTFDALGSNRTHERMLAIMKDSHIGTFGVLSLILYCICMTVILEKVPEMCLLFPLIGRSNALLSCSLSKYARQDGLGRTIIQNTKFKHSANAITLCGVFIVLLQLVSFDSHIVITAGIPMILTFIMTLLITKRVSSKLNGITGDVVGAVIELSSILFLGLSYSAAILVRIIF